jgi:hypothetical protein
MKRISYSDKSLLLGDEAADILLNYAATLADLGRADAVTLHALGSDGNDVDATFLLDSGARLMSETATTVAQEPDNTNMIAYMRERIAVLTTPIVGWRAEWYDRRRFDLDFLD